MAKGARIKVTDTDKGYREFVAAFRELAEGAHVVVGIRGAKGAEVYPAAEGEEAPKRPLTIVEVGAVNEFGTEDGHIPARSFLRATFDAHRARYTTQFVSGLRAILAGKADLDKTLGLLGLRVQADIQTRIAQGIEPANAPATIARKGSEKPLIASGRLRQSIDYEVRRGKRS